MFGTGGMDVCVSAVTPATSLQEALVSKKNHQVNPEMFQLTSRFIHLSQCSAP